MNLEPGMFVAITRNARFAIAEVVWVESREEWLSSWEPYQVRHVAVRFDDSDHTTEWTYQDAQKYLCP